ncbi:hypothetical protein [Haloferula sp. A504]|uniref:hypothetical protein n=1 Tax=Haloferula sp. A504 TaxID=3373601 RepID=UPI0031BDBC25|nr:hypothetical protein [Verrucomicrobiaceae bacterium E54]
MRTGEPAQPPDPVLMLQPRSEAAIRQLFHEDEEFRELCNDYAECVAMLDQLRRGQGGADDRIEQYCELRVNLEHELVCRLPRPPAGREPALVHRAPPTGADVPENPPATPPR